MANKNSSSQSSGGKVGATPLTHSASSNEVALAASKNRDDNFITFCEDIVKPMQGPFVKLKLIQKMRGKALEKYLKELTDELLVKLKDWLAPYDGVALGLQWKDFYKKVEEFINLFDDLDSEDEKLFSKAFVSDFFVRPESLCKSLLRIKELYGSATAERMFSLATLFSDTEINTVWELYGYCLSRRLHFASMLYLIPMYAKGNKQIDDDELYKELAWCIDFVAVPVTTAFNTMLQCRCLPDFEATVHLDGSLEFSDAYTQLEAGYLEPARMTECDLLEFDKDIKKELLRRPSIHKLFSREEFEVNLYNMSVYYADYGIEENPLYQQIKKLSDDVLHYLNDDFEIVIPERDFTKIRRKYQSLELYKDMSGYFEVSASRYPFYRIGETYYSTILFFQRYIVNAINKSLERKKKFQIDSGFVFEKRVIDIVTDYGFVYHKTCKRIEHKEFDVVCVKDGCIYNFQCKNNYINVQNFNTNWIKKVARKHRSLARAYDKALDKEYNREDMLKQELDIDRIESYVITRFPVITPNPRVISFNVLPVYLEDGLFESNMKRNHPQAR